MSFTFAKIRVLQPKKANHCRGGKHGKECNCMRNIICLRKVGVRHAECVLKPALERKKLEEERISSEGFVLRMGDNAQEYKPARP